VANESSREPASPPRAASTAGTITDAMITARVKAELVTDPALEGADVSVSTDKGVVILAGNVRSYDQSAIASAHAQHQDGVMRVDNQLSLELQ
jgi:hyperosmotically inducible protein